MHFVLIICFSKKKKKKILWNKLQVKGILKGVEIKSRVGQTDRQIDFLARHHLYHHHTLRYIN